MNESEIAMILSSKGIRPSIQRVAIYSYIKEHRTHPTVDTIYSALSKQFPTLSKTTVYSTLHTFAEKGLINSVRIEDDELRYDAETRPHIHFKCQKCGKLFDVFDDTIASLYQNCRNTLPAGFNLEHQEINCWGICAECSNKD